VKNRRPNLRRLEDCLPEPQQKRSREKRDQLKRAALVLFGSIGYERTSIEAIGKRANLATGTFYQHYRSKRQLLLVLMDDLLAAMERLQLQATSPDIRTGLHEILVRGFSGDLEYLGAYRAWQEAILSDAQLARMELKIRQWTTNRIAFLLAFLQRQPDARKTINIPVLAHLIDSFFWNLLGEALHARKVELSEWIDAATNLIYHALFLDAQST
jgi:AcrR family transcriptional regulator